MSARLFIDRSLGGKIIARTLRADGWDVVTMWERYGRPGDRMRDVPWLEDVTEAGYAVLTCDAMILSNPVERDAVARMGSRVFALPTSRLTGPEQAARFVTHREAIQRQAEVAGAAGFVVYERHLSRVLP